MTRKESAAYSELLKYDEINIEYFSTCSGCDIVTKTKTYRLEFIEKDWFLYEKESGDPYDNRVTMGRKTLRACPFQILGKAMREVYRLHNPNDKSVFD